MAGSIVRETSVFQRILKRLTRRFWIVPDQILIRPMQTADLPVVVEIEHMAYAFPWSEGVFRDCLKVGYSAWVLENRGVISGYGIMILTTYESHILNICVSPLQHSQGFGRMILEHLLSVAQSFSSQTAYLEVRPSNPVAIGLYEQYGFTQVGLRKGYYPAVNGREDAIVMSLPLMHRA